MAVITRTKAKEVLISGLLASVKIKAKKVVTYSEEYTCFDCGRSMRTSSLKEALDFLFGDKCCRVVEDNELEIKEIPDPEKEKLRQELNSVRKELSDAHEELRKLKAV